MDFRVTRRSQHRANFTSAGPHVLMLVENNSYPRDPRVRREAEALSRAGYQVSVISPAIKGQPWRERVNGVYVYRYPAPLTADNAVGYVLEYGYSMLMMLLMTAWVFMSEGIDIIHAANPPDTLVFIGAIYRLFGKQFIFDHHDLAPEMYSVRFPGSSPNRFIHWLLVQFEKCSCCVANHVFAANQSYKEIEMQRSGISDKAITVLRNGPDLRWPVTTTPDKEIRQNVGTIIVYAGIIGVQDGVDVLIRVIHRLVFELGKADVSCLIVGDGVAVPQLKQIAKTLRVDSFLRFTGWISDPDMYFRHLAAADICVDPCPSNPYNNCCTAIKIMEYMAASKPIVAFDLPEHRFSADCSAAYAAPNDELQFATLIAELMDDAPRRQAMGAAGRQRIEKQLAWHYSAAKLVETYQNVLGLHCGTRCKQHQQESTNVEGYQ